MARRTRAPRPRYQPRPGAAHDYSRQQVQELSATLKRAKITSPLEPTTAAYSAFLDGLAVALRDPAWARAVLLQESDHPERPVRSVRGELERVDYAVIAPHSLAVA